MQLLVTRPQPQADEWVTALRAHSVTAQALPLLQIESLADPAATAAWASLPEHGLVVFVSPGCVKSFFDLRPAAVSWPDGTRAAATGPGTSGAARSRRTGGGHRRAAARRRAVRLRAVAAARGTSGRPARAGRVAMAAATGWPIARASAAPK
jgi:hypothetical protein